MSLAVLRLTGQLTVGRYPKNHAHGTSCALPVSFVAVLAGAAPKPTGFINNQLTGDQMSSEIQVRVGTVESCVFHTCKRQVRVRDEGTFLLSDDNEPSVKPGELAVVQFSDGDQFARILTPPPTARVSVYTKWAIEHDSTYCVPQEVTDEPGLEDVSWHNDVSPSFMWKGADVDNSPILFVDHWHPQLREHGPECKRFAVYMRTNGSCEEDANTLETDDVQAALAHMRKLGNRTHAPLPWRVLDPASADTLEIGPADNHTVLMVHNCGGPDDQIDVKKLDFETQCNVNFILKAVNSHYQLREACAQLLAIVESEFKNDPEPEDLPSWKRAVELGQNALK